MTRANSAESKDPVKYDEEPVNENSKTALAKPENILTGQIPVKDKGADTKD